MCDLEQVPAIRRSRLKASVSEGRVTQRLTRSSRARELAGIPEPTGVPKQIISMMSINHG